MRLWVYGENWVEEAAELLDNLSQNTDMSPEFRLVRGLGYLLMGEISLAKDDFSGNGTAGSLGLSAAYTAEGNMEKAAKECEAVLAAEPKNGIAAQNLKWLRAKPDKQKNK